jgi:hypothetical protein
MERSRLSRASIGGTAVAKSRSNVPVILIAAVVVLAVAGAITYAAVHHGGDATATATSTATSGAGPVAPVAPRTPIAPTVATPLPAAAPAATVSAGALANDLQRDLQQRHLWSTVAVVGDHVDIHSSTCTDPQMKPVLDRVAGDFKSAGLRRLRCLEESGKLVFARDF